MVKSVLESNCKHFPKNGIRENFHLKPEPQMEKQFSIQCFNFTHQNNDQTEKCKQRPSFMSERLRTKRKFCMHLQKFRCFPASAGQKHKSVTRMATNEQEQYLTPIATSKKTTTVVNGLDHQKTVDVEKYLKRE